MNVPGTVGTTTNSWTFVFASATLLYVADTYSVATYNVIQYTYSGSSWARGGLISLSTTAPIYSIAGRLVGSSFVLYASTPSTLYAYDTVAQASTILAVAPTGTVFRGVALPPQNSSWLLATPASTRTATSTPSQTGSQTTTPSNTATATPSSSQTSTQSGTNTPSASDTASATTSTTGTPTSSASTTASPSASISFGTSPTQTQTAAPTTSSTGTGTPSPSQTATGTPSHSQTGTPSGTPTPSRTSTPTPTPSRTGTPTPTPSRTSTPTSSSSPTPRVDSFQAGSVMVVRLGSAANSASTASVGAALPVFLDEYNAVTQSPIVSSIALSTTACTLAVGMSTAGTYYWYDTEGFPSISANGMVVAFPCYSVAVGSTISDSLSTVKTIAVVRADGSTDTTTHSARPYGGSSSTELVAFHNVATVDGTSFYTSGAPGYAGSGYGGVYYTPFGTSTVTAISQSGVGSNDDRCVGIYGGQVRGWCSVDCLGCVCVNERC